MADASLKLEIKLNFPTFFGMTVLLHLLLFVLIKAPTMNLSQTQSKMPRPLKIQVLGEKNAKSLNSVFLKSDPPSMPSLARKAPAKKLDLSDLSEVDSRKVPVFPAPSLRPGQLPKKATALRGLRYGADEFKKMSKDPMFQGGADILNSQKVALNFEVPQGKKRDELNESELRLYSFLKRGAMKYMASVSSEIKDFELKNPHLSFPLTDTKQILTGRLTYDGQGNIKQIKMVRWTNVEKLQGFFENVVKRLDTLQNPPKELWIENGEFTVFITLQING